MTTHPRTLVRTAIAALLETALPAATIYRSRSRPVGRRDGDPQAVEIFTPRETSQRGAGTPGKYERMISVAIAGHVTGGGEDPADVADALALRIEQALEANGTLGGLALDCALTATDMALDGSAWAGAAFMQSWDVLVTSET